MNIISAFHAGIATGTILLFAIIGEIYAERSGILNLGVEGMMLLGAMAGFGVSLARRQSLDWIGNSHSCWRIIKPFTWRCHHTFSGRSSGQRSLFNLFRNRVSLGI